MATGQRQLEDDEVAELEGRILRVRNEARATGLDEWTIEWLVAAEVKIATLQALQELVLEGKLVVGPPAAKRSDPGDPLDRKLYLPGQLPAKGTGVKPC